MDKPVVYWDRYKQEDGPICPIHGITMGIRYTVSGNKVAHCYRAPHNRINFRVIEGIEPMSQDLPADRFDGNGELASYRAEDNAPVYDFDKGWGNRLDGDKDLLDGVTLTIYGIEQGEDFGMGMTVLLLVKFDGDPPDIDKWGVMFSDSSPIIKQARSAFGRSGGRPIRAKMVKNPSKQHKGQSYWTLDRPEQPQLPTPVEEGSKSKK